MNDNKDYGPTTTLMEQGDLGLFGEPLSDSDQKKYNDQLKKEKELEKDHK